MADTPTTTPAPVVSKADKFKVLVEPRTSKAMNGIATLRGLANKNNYDYTPEQVAKVLAALRGEIDVLEKAFSGGKVDAGGFKL